MHITLLAVATVHTDLKVKTLKKEHTRVKKSIYTPVVKKTRERGLIHIQEQ
jgi:hypothetical protein